MERRREELLQGQHSNISSRELRAIRHAIMVYERHFQELLDALLVELESEAQRDQGKKAYTHTIPL